MSFAVCCFDEAESEPMNTVCGVPQESVLGPLLILIYINDMPTVSKIFFLILFADTTNVLMSWSNVDD